MPLWIPHSGCISSSLGIQLCPLQWRSGAGVLQGMRQKACLSHKRTLLPKYNCISDKRIHTSPVQRYRRVKCPSQKPLREAKPAGPEVSYSRVFRSEHLADMDNWQSSIDSSFLQTVWVAWWLDRFSSCVGNTSFWVSSKRSRISENVALWGKFKSCLRRRCRTKVFFRVWGLGVANKFHFASGERWDALLLDQSGTFQWSFWGRNGGTCWRLARCS